MGSPYTSTTPSGYNTNPPSDDGSTTEANRGKWSTIKTKLTDPLNTWAAAVNAANIAAFAKVVGGAGITSTAISYSVVSSDQGKLVRATAASITITTPSATDVGAPFVFAVLNNSSGSITLDGSGAQTVDGSANITLRAGTGCFVFTDGSNWYTAGLAQLGVLPRGYIDGCTLANGTDATNDINIAAGSCRDSTNLFDITVAAMTGKQLDANWAAGGSAGMRNSAAGITNTTYHIYAVAKADGTQDIYAHTSATVATVLTALQLESGGSAYIYARRIGSIVRASSTILGFTQNGDEIIYNVLVKDIDITSPGIVAVSRTLASIPTGIKVRAIVDVCASRGTAATGFLLLVTSLDETDSTPSAALFSLHVQANLDANQILTYSRTIRTNTSAQIRTRQDATYANNAMAIFSRGYFDARGRDD